MVDEEWTLEVSFWKRNKPKEEQALAKWEAKAERAAWEIYLLVENDQRVHFRGFEEDPIKMWELLEKAHLSKKPGACQGTPSKSCFHHKVRQSCLCSRSDLYSNSLHPSTQTSSF